MKAKVKAKVDANLTRLLAAVALVSARSLACPSCAASTTAASGGAGVWWIVGVFLLIPPLIALAIAAAIRRESRGRDNAIPEPSSSGTA